MHLTNKINLLTSESFNDNSGFGHQIQSVEVGHSLTDFPAVDVGAFEISDVSLVELLIGLLPLRVHQTVAR